MKIAVGVGALSIKTLTVWAEGEWMKEGYVSDHDIAVTHLCTDSRESDGQTLLCVLRGERVDGHDYMASAHARGCRVFLCERIPADMPLPYVAIVVKDTVFALGRLAAGYRRVHLRGLCSIAITGSVGKTTTKECVAAALSCGERVFKKDGNFNSTIGLPLTVMEMMPTGATGSPSVAVLEMGMSGFGEIHAMTSAVSPHMAMITNIGSSHLEYLGTRENIARAKLEILNGMGKGDILLINGDEPLLAHASAMAPVGVQVMRVSLNDPAADVYACVTGTHAGGMTFDVTFTTAATRETWHRLWVPALGEHMVWAGAFASATAYLRGLDDTVARAGLKGYRPAAMRQDRREVGGVTLLNDCYNAAPESMRAALGVLTYVAKGRRIAVLGDMKELGEREVELHRAVGRDYAHAGIDILMTVGALGREIGQGALEAGMPTTRVFMYDEDYTYASLVTALADILRTEDTVLFKASRAMRLEKISEGVVERLSK